MKAVISGYGKMGHIIEKVLEERGIECAGKCEDIASFDPCLARECVCIDFTTPEAFRSNYPVIARNFKAAVVGTTGWNDIACDVIKCFEDAGTPMIYASNFSIGVNVTFALARLAAQKLKDYDASIVETHHIHKLDAPSGTAVTLAQIVKGASSAEQEVPIESRRIGEVPGIHSLELRSEADRITITHEAFSRRGFAVGAVTAAQMTQTLEGVHCFSDLIIDSAL